MDLSGPYRATFDTMLPDAVQVADPFHVVKHANAKLDECRRRVQNETPVVGDGVTTAPTVNDPPVPVVVALHEEVARHLLESNGFRVEIMDEGHPVVAVGEVISQEPSGGSTPSPGSLVTIHVSLGPIPDVDGWPVREALAELRDAGFHVHIEITIVPPGDTDDGRVLGQTTDPTSGASVVLEVGFDGT